VYRFYLIIGRPNGSIHLKNIW